MKIRFVLFSACFLTASMAFAQSPSPVPGPKAKLLPPAALPSPGEPATPAAPAPPAVPFTPQPPSPPRQPINIKIELTISEEGGTAPPVRKVVNAVAGDGFNGSVRETASAAPGTPPTALNVDVYPVILANGKIRLTCNLQYTTDQGQSQSGGPGRTDIRQNLVLILESGKSLVVSEAAGPVSDRHVTVEVKATILK